MIAKRDELLTCPECEAVGITRTFKKSTGRGAHRKAAHGVLGSSPASAKWREEHPKVRVKCFYCPETFMGVRWRSRHINAKHPGAATEEPPNLPVPVLGAVTTEVKKKGKKPNGTSPKESIAQTTEEFDFYQTVARTAGYLEGIAHGLAAREGYVPEEFTRQCVEYLHRQTLR